MENHSFPCLAVGREPTAHSIFMPLGLHALQTDLLDGPPEPGMALELPWSSPTATCVGTLWLALASADGPMASGVEDPGCRPALLTPPKESGLPC